MKRRFKRAEELVAFVKLVHLLSKLGFASLVEV
jgi:hypothetical protein